MVSIFAFFLIVTFADGVTDEFAIAAPSMEECEHFAGHVQDWIDQTGAVVEHLSPCEEIVLGERI